MKHARLLARSMSTVYKKFVRSLWIEKHGESASLVALWEGTLSVSATCIDALISTDASVWAEATRWTFYTYALCL